MNKITSVRASAKTHAAFYTAAVSVWRIATSRSGRTFCCGFSRAALAFGVYCFYVLTSSPNTAFPNSEQTVII